MKSALLIVAAATGTVLMLVGCASQSGVTSASASVSTDPTRSVYTRDDLRNTGRQDTASAIEAIDPSVR